MLEDLPILVVTYIYLFGVLGTAEGLRRWRGYPTDFTRKVIHIAAGMSAYILLLFRHLPMVLIPPISFIFINIASYRMGLFQAMETGRRGNLGTIYFPISFTVLTWLLWEHQPLLVAALMPMTWGDALAAIVGQRAGQHTYRVLDSTRSLEGSLSMFVAAWVATTLPLLLLSGSPFPGWSGVLVALVVAAVATLIEAVSPWGIDNLTVPAVSALALWIAQMWV